MLTRLFAAVCLIGAVLVATGTSPASADGGLQCYGDSSAGTYHCIKPGSSDPGSPGSPDTGGNAPAQPTCALDKYPSATYCNGDRPCYQEEALPPIALPKGPKPQPDSKAMVEWCFLPYPQQGPPGMRVFWSDSGTPPTPPLTVQAAEATGKLDLAIPAVNTSPIHRTLVNVPTWFWVDGAPDTQQGTSAFGLVAIATVRSLNVTTGDGATLSCPWTTSAQQAETDCHHEYTHASYDGTETWQGRPAYAISATATWDVHFEMNGVRIDIPGAPATLQSPASTAVLRVDEVQTIVTDAR
jgi:hypothetical protein